MRSINQNAKRSARPRTPLAALGLVALLGMAHVNAAPGDPPGSSSMPAPQDSEVVNGVTFDYVRIAGAAFVPFADSAAFAYSGSGCIHSTGGSESRFAHKLELPAGSIVKYVRMYYFDNSASAVTTYFTTYDAAGNFTEVATVASTDTGGYGSALTAEMNYEVDTISAPVNIVANLGTQNDSSLQFCGVRIAYVPVITDRIFADGFD